MNKLVGGAFVLATIYAILPTLVVRIFGFGAYKRGGSLGVALTFDDGPHPDYTPKLLNLLQSYQVKATFFVLGSKAEQYPELILRMHQEGHLIGIHNYVHWSNALMTPWKVRRELNRSVAVIERIIGERPIYYRPPWGVINLFDFFLLKHFRMVLWSLIVGDWLSRGGKQKIKHKLLAQMKDGAVIVLHDSGTTFGADEDAPGHMIDALHEFLEETQQKNYTFVRMDEKLRMDEKALAHQEGLFKKILISLWMKWEIFYHLLFRLRPVDTKNQLLHIRVCTYRGKDLELEDGERIRKGDQVIELHLDNGILYQLGQRYRSPVRLAIQLIRAMEELLPKLAEMLITDDPKYIQVKGLYGITLINRGTKQLGFTVMDLTKGLFSYFTQLYLKWLLFVIHPQGRKRLAIKTELLIPKIIAISKKELLKKYSSDHSIQTNMPAQVTHPQIPLEQGVFQSL